MQGRRYRRGGRRTRRSRTGSFVSSLKREAGVGFVALQLFPLLLAGGIARVARRLAFGFKRCFAGGGLFFFARELDSGLRRRLGIADFLLGLGGVARQFGLGAIGDLRLALGLPLLDQGIVETRLGAKLVQNVLPGLLRGLLPVGEARFLESTH